MNESTMVFGLNLIILLFSICLVGSNPSHLIKSNVLNDDIRRYCRPDKYCKDGNKTTLCPLYASICNKTTNELCSADGVRDVRAEQGVPGLKNWQLTGTRVCGFSCMNYK
jgi:hypothetical protein